MTPHRARARVASSLDAADACGARGVIARDAMRARGRAGGRGGDASLFDPFFWYVVRESFVAIRRAWTSAEFEPRGAVLTLAIVFAERVGAWAPFDARALMFARGAAVCPARALGRRGTAGAFARACGLATCAHGSDFHAVYNAGSLFVKMVETERRVRASVAGEASAAAATCAFALCLGALSNALAAVSATYVFPDLARECFQGSGGLLFALKTYRARADFAAGYRGRVSFFGFIDVPAELASLAEIAILYMLDSSPAMLNLYGAGAVVGFTLASFESVAMRALARATRAVSFAFGIGPRVRVGSRVVLTGMRNGSLNGQWGTVAAVPAMGDEVTVRLDSDGRRVTALRVNLLVP